MSRGVAPIAIHSHSRSDQLQTDESTASLRQHEQDEASPVLPDYMQTTGRPATSVERKMIAQYARSHQLADVQADGRGSSAGIHDRAAN